MINTFAERLKFALEKKGFSQAEAARRCDISQQSINYIISNNLKSSKLAAKIASSLEINSNWLIYGEGQFSDIEKQYYKIPVFNTVYMIQKFINNDLEENEAYSMIIDLYLGDITFAFLIEPNKLVICSQNEYNSNSKEFLCISGRSAHVSKNKPTTDLAFYIIEWRIRCGNFQFS